MAKKKKNNNLLYQTLFARKRLCVRRKKAKKSCFRERVAISITLLYLRKTRKGPPETRDVKKKKKREEKRKEKNKVFIHTLSIGVYLVSRIEGFFLF